MNSTRRRPAVERYLDELDEALRDMRADDRAEIVAGVREHIEASLGDDDVDDGRIRRVLADVGDPLAIAAAHGEGEGGAQRPDEFGRASSRVPMLERDWVPAATVLAFLLGGLLFWLLVPIAFSVLGLVLLWLSPLWRVGEKVLGTLMLGILPFVFGLMVFGAFGTTSEVCRVGDGVDETVCTGGGTNWLGIALLVTLVVGMVATAVLLWRRGSRRAVPQTRPTAPRRIR